MLCFCSNSLFGASATWSLNANGSWNVNGNWTPATFPNAIDDTASFLSIISANRLITLGQDITVGTLNFDDNNNYSLLTGNTLFFQTTAGNAALNLTTVNGAGVHSITCPVSLTSTLLMTHSSTAAFTISGVISGAGGITKAGTGTGALVLSAANSYLGSTNINTGNLTYSANGAIPAGNSVTIGDGGGSAARLTVATSMTVGNSLPITINSNGTLAQNSNITVFLSSYTGSGATILSTGTGNTSLFQVSNTSDNLYSGTISGGATSTSLDPAVGNRFLKTGTSTLTLTGASTFTSRTFIENGVINVQNAAGLGATGTNSGIFVRAVGANGALYLENNITLPKRVLLNGSGFGGLGALRNVSGNNTISGAMQIGWAGGTETASNATMQIDSGTSLTLSGVISGANSLTKTGTGSLTYSGTTANTQTGATIIDSGILNLNKTTGINAIVGSATINTGGTLSLTVPNVISNTSIVTISGGLFDFNANTDTIGSLIFNSGTLSQGGAILTLAGTTPTTLSMGDGTSINGPITFSSTGGVTYSGTTSTASISGNVNLGTGAHVFNIANGSDAVDMDISGIISNTGPITKSTGTGTLQYSGLTPNTNTGITTINAGELLLNKPTAIVAIAANTVINAGGTLSLNAANPFGATSLITLSGGTFNMAGNNAVLSALTFTSGTLTQSGGTLTLSNATTALTMGATTISGDLTFTGAGAINFNGATTRATISGNVNLGLSTRIVNLTNGIDTIDMEISGSISGTGGLTKSTGIGELQYSGTNSNTYTGLTTLNAGTLSLNKTTPAIAIAGNTTVNVGGTLSLSAIDQFSTTSLTTLSGGTFNMNGNNSSMGSFTYTSGTFTQGGALLSLASNVTALTMGATTITGDIALTGSGAVSFNGAATAATISGNIDLGSNIHTFSITNGAASPDMVLSGIISGSGGITKTGATSVLQLSGTSANTFTGLTTQTNGTLLLAKSSGIVAIAGDLTISGGTALLGALGQFATSSTVTISGGIWSLSGFDVSISRLNFTSGTYTPAGAVLTLSDNTTALSMASTTISGSIILSGTGDVLFTGASGTATLSGPVDLGGMTHAFNINNGTTTNDMLASNVISNGALTKIGAGRLSFSGAGNNTYSGLTTVTDGTLHLNKTSGINAIAGDVLINGGIVLPAVSNQIADTSTMTIDSGSYTMGALSETFNELIFNGGSIGVGTLTLPSNTTALTMRDTSIPGGTIILSGTGSVNFDSTNNGTATLANSLNLTGSTHSFNIAEGSAPIDMSISGVISGTGGVTKLDTGALEFAGTSANLFSGLTTVTAGELLLNKTPSINAIADDILINGGMLTLSAANQISNSSVMTLDTGTFEMGDNNEEIDSLVFSSGTISQSTAILTLQSATTALTMRNTTITGALSLIGGGDIDFDPTNSGTATISGSVSLAAPTMFNIPSGAADIDMDVSGPISGVASVEKAGTGTLLFTGTNSYSGGTTITTGKLQGNTDGLQGSIINESQLVFDQDFDGIYAGAMTGTVGTLVKQGTGLVNLTSTNVIGGATSITDGTLAVNGPLSGAGGITVTTSGKLQGDGPITKDIVLFGKLAPGNSIGTITLIGDQTFATGSTLENELNPSISDLVDITGSLTIQPGATLSILLEPANYLAPFIVTMVQTTTGVSGTFSTVLASLPLFEGVVIYTPTTISLQGGFLPIADLITTGNAGAVAQCIKDLPKPAGSDLAFIVNQIRNLATEDEIQNAMIQLQPSALTSLSIAAQDDVIYLRNTIFNHLDQQTQSDCSKNNYWTLWGTVFGAQTYQHSQNEEPGFRASSPGAFLGIDAPNTSPIYFGGGLGYTHTNLKWKKNRGKSHIDTVYGLLYGRWQRGIFALQSALMGGYNFYQIKRKIKFTSITTIDRTAKSSPQGVEGTVSLKGEMLLKNDHIQIAPYVSLDYLYLYRNSFRESGANSLDLNLKGYHADLLVSEGGIEVSHYFSKNRYIITPYLQLGVVRESRFMGKKEKATIGGCPFTVGGLNPSRTLFNSGLGINFKTCDSMQLNAFYKGRYGKSFSDNSFYLTCSIDL